MNINEVEKLAELSRIRLTDEEKSRFQEEIGSILNFVSQINEFTSGSKDIDDGRAEVRSVLRADAGPHERGIYTESILNNAPRREGDYLKVKKIL
ncbi:MAG: hypothetical protein A3G52_03925 [Candidatus Taylorbacteria bacterium RIFCSPLOWO2_12_FULL_43_20]|uniref:Aspartyl/glutamyl-tRNA(Asn/Gln) amidotransferase subunit C n=1 Tax=Candidatus Taylorbacteria bacterium RIFCSPLOWO2_12_FULL_43_20 TaxID=1802332 RepID=A0A1G2P1U2_9BACT|nr:MAG: hypothetical protein A2825_02200 [Candidatus Taylorbacteria bacterium RIFCSPHIGHO2_01_FULL_43_120]OHA22833.1 MAG: hypothetical protein A3B98_01405 [Candidatus Taylorbacteria bacterium RIFCSPHIGHO2_02_FULL_43_55]OHA29386.1 MAG: hypothetical protein A3E92_02500 [Candidatus Taylorbacteria bacterium RIFCSPHIGHO2_12_FULL_42_34]OHA31762.1 MAG: hypothetical protein A3B09_01940 [Candidatus Taylorbacteria bacterium RIFCSPLOWO2_01_FULL_43_83]OHA38577.1 MAG: hypothetical protein A3H58_00225 [Candi